MKIFCEFSSLADQRPPHPSQRDYGDLSVIKTQTLENIWLFPDTSGIDPPSDSEFPPSEHFMSAGVCLIALALWFK